ncbi:MAG: hypothetical protein GXO27_00590 [Chlorobi bacterium]|nr:hypothetical protein [Chlorobiota bacterium]
MRITGPIKRIKPRYTQPVSVPPEHKSFLWDEKDQAPLEKYVYRVLSYGNFRDIKNIFVRYPEAAHYVANTYPEIPRGVRYWVNVWYDER